MHYKRNRMTGALYDEHTYVGSGSAVSQSFALSPDGRNFMLADNGDKVVLVIHTISISSTHSGNGTQVTGN